LFRRHVWAAAILAQTTAISKWPRDSPAFSMNQMFKPGSWVGKNQTSHFHCLRPPGRYFNQPLPVQSTNCVPPLAIQRMQASCPLPNEFAADQGHPCQAKPQVLNEFPQLVGQMCAFPALWGRQAWRPAGPVQGYLWT
jgi:hypothetical protein